MKLSKILNKDARVRNVSRWTKRVARLAAPPRETTPVFICGLQRSGTTMLMDVFHRHPDTEVYDEHKGNRVFSDFRIRDWGTVAAIVAASKARAVCFKIIADSHLMSGLLERFPTARFLWAYRDYRDVANSRLRKFENPTRAIRLVCRGESGGGWFQEGVSPGTEAVLREVYSDALTDFDLACLTWWARNRLVVEQNIGGAANVRLVRYEELVVDPRPAFAELFRFLDLPASARAVADVHARSISRHPHPPLDPKVQALCESLAERLDSIRAREAGTARIGGGEKMQARANWATAGPPGA